jgi:hypothetical protein
LTKFLTSNGGKSSSSLFPPFPLTTNVLVLESVSVLLLLFLFVSEVENDIGFECEEVDGLMLLKPEGSAAAGRTRALNADAIRGEERKDDRKSSPNTCQRRPFFFDFFDFFDKIIVIKV